MYQSVLSRPALYRETATIDRPFVQNRLIPAARQNNAWVYQPVGDTHVQILLATHNSARFLAQQLQSIADQDHENWSLWVSDDGSTDETLEILEDFATRIPQPVHVKTGPRQGIAANFISLLNHPGLCETCPVAFADHDDIWFRDKLTRSLRALEGSAANGMKSGPKLFCGATLVVDEELTPLRHSSPRKQHPSFSNALVENIAGGNTMVLNPAATKLLRRAGKDIDVPYHDWWIYLAVSAAGGQVIYEDKPLLFYRQHQSNSRGDRQSWHARLRRLRELLDGTFRDWNTRNFEALSKIENELGAEARIAMQARQKREVDSFSHRVGARLARGFGYRVQRQKHSETILIHALARIGIL